MDLGITGHAAIVTGGSKGIGRACVETLLAEGANVCAVSRDITLLDELVASSAGHLVTASCDLTTVEGCDLAAKACLDAFDRIDILVNCAGSAGMGNVLEISADDVDDALLLKFHGYLRMAQRVIPSMTERRWGRIVNIAGTSPTADNLPTSLANIAVHNLTRALSDELTSSGIQVNLVAPGLTLTDRAVTLVARAAEQQGRSPQELIAEVGSGLPAGRAADPAEVARVVCFLASDACSYVQASVLYMDGGARRATP
ncbi:SDR family oxidoreductase [Rhodococcus qingshengii]|jgi:NAD(P)-dependent dehydrogenase (short-subunit alcohol dehydrogenase family)|uniref:SDR family oxidoreductase n=1 Tax=Rhodococcus qingshengii TaxID=334542 RepID=UPI001ADF449F|nr:SDR family oxidoreductase [Rhodococcus qingshengii]